MKFSNISEVFMFCPRCSREQVYENVRFCSRCGFKLSVVRALLGDDDSPSPKISGANAFERSRRKRDMTIGALLMFLFSMHTAWTTEDLSLDREYASLIVKCLILSALIYAVPALRDFFRRRALRQNASSPGMLSRFAAESKDDDQSPAALPQGRGGTAAANYFSADAHPAEFLAPPPSVTEETTDLLRRRRN